MELRQLRYFLRVADFKSFSRAALAVRIAQPALSRHIRKLEEEMGVALFYRDGRGAILTEQGQRYYERVADILRQLDEAGAELLGDDDSPTGEVALGVPTELGPRFILQIVQSFRSRYPSARIRVAESGSAQIAEWLQSSRLDAGFIYDPQDYQTLPIKSVVEETLYLIGPKGDRITAPESVPFRHIVQLPLILPELGGNLRERIACAAARLGQTAHCETDIDSLPAIKQAVTDGAGYSILPYAVVGEEVRRGLLSAARVVEPDLVRPLGFAIRPNGALSLVTNKLVALVQHELSKLLDNGETKSDGTDQAAPKTAPKSVSKNTRKSASMSAHAAEAV